uniref:Uncharacterized protein n=1 Tax=Arundo donax TaxID=35708 RepID=A0A0A9ACN4_ARUDO
MMAMYDVVKSMTWYSTLSNVCQLKIIL